MSTKSLFQFAPTFQCLLGCLVATALLVLTFDAAAQVPSASDNAGLTGTAGTADFGGKLLLTGGVSQIEGSAGGGLTPWAVIGGYGTGSQVGGNAHATYVHTQDFAINSYGAEIGIANRVELSMAHQQLNTRSAGAALGLGAGYRINMDTFGVKVRVLGDAVLDQDTWVPQIAVGMQFKHNNNGALVKALGARSDSGTDFYVSATKLLLAQSLLLNGTLRMTKANQFGILGFGGDKSNSYKAAFEASAAYLLSKSIAVGVEYRMKPNNLGFAREQDAYDAFIAWAPTKYFSLTFAYVDLGDIATFRRQRGVYGSAQVGF
ncbi:hypothetical protein JOE11_004084 [Robbsia andropogonis]|uniref:DUF3034 family protein n=1 Tax=Robbsia andropogonis TaxID=28092 RepID=UPI00209D8BBF|nr:DUF3034 family protein [Robbsia andropogonis]MCP1117966.1 DUF3034 family protein [Robbsia andropogonis]MCP1127431.1 DUF3034 family protein [Robbsia andropogonis]